MCDRNFHPNLKNCNIFDAVFLNVKKQIFQPRNLKTEDPPVSAAQEMKQCFFFIKFQSARNESITNHQDKIKHTPSIFDAR
jgi:hypothetical protein